MIETSTSPTQPAIQRLRVNDNALLLAGSLLLAYILLAAGHTPPLRSFLDNPRHVASVLRGEYVSDLAQDLIGFRLLARDENPYPVLGPALRELGILWNVPHASTHPPTAFVLVGPVAMLPYPTASALWAVSTLCLLAVSLRLYGLPWKRALGLTPLLLLWTPTVTSLGQFTALWLFGLALAFKFRRQHTWAAGLGIGLAAGTKLVPALVLVPFLLKRKPAVLFGFALAVGGLMVAVAWLSPDAFAQYFEVNRTNSLEQIRRTDNGALLPAMHRWFGVPGLLAAGAGLCMVVYRNRAAFVGPDISERAFHLAGYVTVCLLPVAWNYSVLPLLALVLYLLRSAHRLTVTYAASALLVGALLPAWGPVAAVGVVVTIALIGRALLFPPTV